MSEHFMLDICDYNVGDASLESQKELGLEPAEIYTNAENMARLALTLKKNNGHDFCSLPLCHTLEAETLGGNVNLGDQFAGPRVGKPIYDSVFDIKVEQKPENFTRAQVMLDACKMLAEQGEKVRFGVATPFNVVSCLVDSAKVFREWSKKKDAFYEKLDEVAPVVKDMAERAVDAGACAISLIDGPTAVAIVGEKRALEVSDRFTYRFVCEIAEEVGSKVPIYLCPICIRTDVEYPKNVIYMKDCPAMKATLDVIE